MKPTLSHRRSNLLQSIKTFYQKLAKRKKSGDPKQGNDGDGENHIPERDSIIIHDTSNSRPYHAPFMASTNRSTTSVASSFGARESLHGHQSMPALPRPLSQ
ncbi:hypothetical protein HK104_004333, partial [Borealophlyctis nickersoniae]